MIKISSNNRSRKLKPPSEIEASLRLSINGKNKQKEEQTETTTTIETPKPHYIKVQRISRQENKAIPASKKLALLRVAEAGFFQSLIISWYGSATVPTVNFQLDLGKYGSFHVNFIEYYDAGVTVPHSAQDFWVSKYDDTNKKYAIALTPTIPIEFNELRLVMTNNNVDSLTVNVAQIKYYQEIKK